MLIHIFHRYVLEQILSGEPTEVVVEAIHDYLTKIGEDVRNNRIKVDDFIINKVIITSFVFGACSDSFIASR